MPAVGQNTVETMLKAHAEAASLGAQWCFDTAHAGASMIRKQLANWVPSRQPADMDLLPDLAVLVARARDLNRNNGVASGTLQTLQDNVAGYGLRLAAIPDYRALGRDIDWAEQWSQQVEALWKVYAESTACDITGQMTFATMTQLIFRSALENGEALALVMWEPRPTTPVRTCLQLIESDRLSNPFGILPTNTMIGGVEKDVYGRPLAYYIQQAPQWVGGYALISNLTWTRVEAETAWGRKRVLYLHSQERIGQTRGRPILAPIIEQFRMLDAYQRTELQSSIVNALIAGVIETPLDSETLATMVGGDPSEYLAAKNEYRVQLEGGSMIPLYPGDKMTPFVPARPANSFPAFVQAISRQIGTALGLPYELALKDFSQTNYSSARAALMEAWRSFIIRRSWLSSYWAAQVYRLWLEEMVNAGAIEAPDFYANQDFYSRSKWIGQGRGWIDPTKEAEAAQIRMQAGISTLELECAEQGLDWNEVLEQQALEQRRREELGLPPMATLSLTPLSAEKPGQEGGSPGEPAQQAA
jgi:lambda family phage portal protein